MLREPGLAAARLPKNIGQSLLDYNAASTHSPQWIQVCGVKAAYIRGFSQEKINNLDDALEMYTSMLPYLSSMPSLGRMSPEFRLWCERLLTRMVALTMSVPPGERLDLDRTLQMFHLWTSLFRLSPPAQKLPTPYESSPQAPPMVELGSEVLYSRWDVWMDYYNTLSYILKKGFVYSPSYSEAIPLVIHSRMGISDEDFLKVRLRQRAELKKVEASMETKLLEETRFPKANERNQRVEKWIDSVMQNWRIMCGPTWQDAELGEGGKNALARGVLDILYRAATKTYHSTQILRHLFIVHAYVADFDLAFKAFDSYVELVSRGKERAAKGGDVDSSLDRDDDVILTAAEAIRILCRFGARHEAERARDIAKKLEQWLDYQRNKQDERPMSPQSYGSHVEPPVSEKAISIAYHALGTSEANWARWTYDASSRSEIQAKAVQYLRQALDSRWGNSDDLEILYTYALLLAESRDIPGAVRLVKAALAQQITRAENVPGLVVDGLAPDTGVGGGSLDFAHERKLVPFWHLLALLLTARADPTNASKACDAAFEQFQDLSNLFGNEDLRPDQLNEKEKQRDGSGYALVDRMGRFEKEGIIQIKITQITLIEELEGPTAAVDSSTELLALYARLFGDLHSDKGKTDTRLPPKPPKSAISSIRASILGRGRSRKRGENTLSVAQVSTRPSTRGTATTAAPTIQVTDETGSAAVQTNGHHESPSMFRRKSQYDGCGTPSSRPESVKLRKRSTSVRRRSEESARPESTLTATDPIPITDATANEDGTVERDFASITTAPRPSTATPSVVGTSPRPSVGPDQPLREIPHNLPREQLPPPPEHDDQPPKQDTRLPAPHPATKKATPEPRFAVIQERRHKVTLLVELWTFVAGMYIRAALFDDGKGAIDEAEELVQSLENEIATVSSSAKAFSGKSWGGGKPVEELWGDVWAKVNSIIYSLHVRLLTNFKRGELSRASSAPFDAISHFEKALAHCPDHAGAILGLTVLLLDIYEQKIPPEPPEYSALSLLAVDASRLSQLKINDPTSTSPDNTAQTAAQSPDSPEALNRLAARDRAYQLLSTLTKLGEGWDSSEAWLALARAYELSGQVDKAKDALWWVVELEDTRPIRSWKCVGPGGFAL